jgi:hypothetical protein
MAKRNDKTIEKDINEIKEIKEINKEQKDITAIEKEIKQVESAIEAITNKGKTERPTELKDDEIFIDGQGVIKLKPTKLKYFKDNSYNNYTLIKQMGVSEVLKYSDGEDIIKKFLGASFDIDYKTIDYMDDMDVKTLMDMIDKMNAINEIKETDFFNQLERLEVKEE